MDYSARKVEFGKEKERYEQSSFVNSMWRLAVFCVTITGIYLGVLYELGILTILLGVGGAALFLYLVKRQGRLREQKLYYGALERLNARELQFAAHDYGSFRDGNEYGEENHPYSHDVDLFGYKSFFQYINRSETSMGRSKLAGLLKENNTQGILDRQACIQELSGKVEWIQDFHARASMIDDSIIAQKVEDWLKEYEPIVPKVFKWIIPVFGILSILSIIIFVLELSTELLPTAVLFVGLAISGVFVKRINKIANSSGQMIDIFRQYFKLMSLIEQEQWRSSLTIKWLETTRNEDQKASEILGQFSKILNALDQRNNIIVAIFANGFFLRDILVMSRIDQWVELHKQRVSNWFHVIHTFDAYNTLGIFAKNHPDYKYPELTDHYNTMNIEALGHPLIKNEQRKVNDLAMSSFRFMILTGANMAGKSTFLRTISLAIISANVGLPVCAKRMEYSPIKLISSMRTTDSLSEEASYFFSELSRLKYIMEKLEEDNYFIVLDEILKGTNSVDKAEGSKKFLKKLLRQEATGIIATHDLSLCEVAKEEQQVRNFYFDAQIIDDELFFDYKMKEGICKNMNANFLLQKMNLV